MELNGRTALITGSCGEGMGRSIALRLAHDGANIVLNYGSYRRGDEVHNHAEEIVSAITDFGSRAIICQADTRDEQQVKQMVSRAVTEFGQVDILVNNAGGDWKVRDYIDIRLDDWKSVLSAEIDGAFLTMKYVVPGMRERKWGRIIHIGLDAILKIDNTVGLAPDYCLGKAARAWMTTAFGNQEIKKGIAVNCIEPGLTDHMKFEDALKAACGDLSDWRARERFNCHDVAELVAYLCSEAGRFVSGNTIQCNHFWNEEP